MVLPNLLYSINYQITAHTSLKGLRLINSLGLILDTKSRKACLSASSASRSTGIEASATTSSTTQIGLSARNAIAIASLGQQPPRPLTHDLITNIFDVWEMDLEKVIIHTLRDNTFYAILCLNQGGVKKEIDCRPSDAIAIALRANSPIWVVEEVVADASIPVDRDADEAERQAFRDFVSNISPSELIKRSPFREV